MSTSAVPGKRKSSRRLVAGERPPATFVLPTARVRAKLPAAPARAREGSGAPVTWKVVSMRRPNVAQSSWCDWAKIAPLLEANIGLGDDVAAPARREVNKKVRMEGAFTEGEAGSHRHSRTLRGTTIAPGISPPARR